MFLLVNVEIIFFPGFALHQISYRDFLKMMPNPLGYSFNPLLKSISCSFTPIKILIVFVKNFYRLDQNFPFKSDWKLFLNWAIISSLWS